MITQNRNVITIIFLLCLSLTSSAWGETYSFQPIADAHVQQTAPLANFGSLPYLRVRTINGGNGFHAYLKFNVQGVAGKITSAKLKIHVRSNSIASVGVYNVPNSNWDEAAINWNNQPIQSAMLIRQVSANANSCVVVDVTSAVAGNGLVTIGLATSEDLPDKDFYSKESSFPPVLEVSAESPKPTGSCRTPDELLLDLHRALAGTEPLFCNFYGHLNLNFINWVKGGSHNLPVIAAAIALFYDPTGLNHTKRYDIVDWLKTFLKAQVGLTSPSSSLQYLKGSETNSNTYDATVVTSVLAVHYWATVNNDRELGELARKYLRATWVIYGLAAGSSWAESVTAGDTLLMQCKPPKTPRPVSNRGCNSQLKFDGPYIALAGARSGPAHFGDDDRAPLFARAGGFRLTKNKGESAGQKNTIEFLIGNWPGNSRNESVFATDARMRNDLQNLVMQDQLSANLLNELRGIKTIRPYHFLGWPNGIRATYMEGNPNRNSSCIFAAAYFQEGKKVFVLNPWPEGFQNKGLAEGYCFMDIGFIEAGNLNQAEQQALGREPIIQRFDIPTAQPLWHVILKQEPY